MHIGDRFDSGASGSPAARLLADHIGRHPHIEAADLYKLLHQGVFGAEHALRNVEAARQWFDDEIASCTGDDDSDYVVEPLPPTATFARVHLRPFLHRQLNPALLFQAFVATAEHSAGTMQQMDRAVALLDEVPVRDALVQCNVSHDEVREFMRAKRERGYPATHHSTQFRAHHRPAYRVVAIAHIAQVLDSASAEER